MSALLDALGWVGESLDKPGRAVRGALGGQGLGAFKNLIPFSDTAGITDPSQAVSGRDLLQQWGAVGERDQDEGIGLGDIAGFGAEMALDPTTYLGIGTLKHLGRLGKLKAASKAASPAGDVSQITGRGAAFADKAAPVFPGVTPLGRMPSSAPADAFLSVSEANAARQAAGMRPLPSAPSLQPGQLPTRSSLSQPLQHPIEGFNRSPGLASRVSAFTDVQSLDAIQAAKIDAMLARGKDIAPNWAVTFSPPGSSGPAGWLGKNLHLGQPGNADDALRQTMDSLASRNSYQSFGHGVGGMYDPDTATSVVFRGASNPSKTLAHEMGHGITDQGWKLGRMDELPWLERIPAKLQHMYQNAPVDDSLNQLAGGFSQITDELAQHAREGGSVLGQIGSGLKFAFPTPRQVMRNPREIFDLGGLAAGVNRYAPTIRNRYMTGPFRDFNPASAEIFRRLGNSPYQAAAAGAGIGAGSLLEHLLMGE